MKKSDWLVPAMIDLYRANGEPPPQRLLDQQVEIEARAAANQRRYEPERENSEILRENIS